MKKNLAFADECDILRVHVKGEQGKEFFLSCEWNSEEENVLKNVLVGGELSSPANPQESQNNLLKMQEAFGLRSICLHVRVVDN